MKALRWIVPACMAALACGAALAQPLVRKDVPYGSAGGVKLLMDVYEPDGSETHPGILLIHGGAWVGGDKSFYAPLGARLSRLGFVAFSINYRLLPAFKYPAALDDAQLAVRFVRAHAAEYHLDPDHIGALGDSAGGYLVAMLGLRPTRDNSDPKLAGYSSKVQCVVDFYGPTDFSVPVSTAGLSNQAIFIVTMFLGKSQQQDPALYKESSPVTYVTQGAPPFLILHGTGDQLVPDDQSERLADSLHAAGDDATLFLDYRAPHGFLDPSHPGLFGPMILAFFRSHLMASDQTHGIPPRPAIRRVWRGQ